jgi:hypothetical protein
MYMAPRGPQVANIIKVLAGCKKSGAVTQDIPTIHNRLGVLIPPLLGQQYLKIRCTKGNGGGKPD